MAQVTEQRPQTRRGSPADGDAPRRAILDEGAAADYVLSRRTPDGGYSFYRTPDWGIEEPNAPDTLAALDSLRLLGVEAPGVATTVRWLRELQVDDGYATLTIGWSTLRSLDLVGARPRRSAAGWLRACVRRLSERDVEDASPAGAIADALRIAEAAALVGEGVVADARPGIATLLEATWDSAGGWARPGADLETTASALEAARAAGLPSPRSHLIRFLGACADERLGYRLSPQAQATSAGALRAGLVLARGLGVPPLQGDAVARSLRLLQRPDGGLGARHWAISTLRDTWRGLQAAWLLAHPCGGVARLPEET